MQPGPCLTRLHAQNVVCRHERKAGTHADSRSHQGKVQFLDPELRGLLSHASTSIGPTELDEPPPAGSLPDCREQTAARAAVRSNTLPLQSARDIAHVQGVLENDVLCS